jgi:hypothetical protein
MLLSNDLTVYLCSYVPEFHTEDFSSNLDIERCRNIEVICHSMLTLAFAPIGGMFALLIAGQNRDERTAVGSDTRASNEGRDWRITDQDRRGADLEAIPNEAQFNIVARGDPSGFSGGHPLRGVQGDSLQGGCHPRDGDFHAQEGELKVQVRRGE